MSEQSSFDAADDGTVSLGGSLTFESVPLLYREMERRLPGARPVTTIDLADVTEADSAGLALLLEWQSRQLQRGRELTMLSAPENLVRLAELCEAVDMLKLSGRAPKS
jgi:phospholipid transport system transporter-binding protein